MPDQWRTIVQSWDPDQGIPQQDNSWHTIIPSYDPDRDMPKPEKSYLEQGIDWWDNLTINKPITKMLGIDLPKIGRTISDSITDPNSTDFDAFLKWSPAGVFGVRPEVQRGFLGGAIEGASQVAESLTSPLNLASVGLSWRAKGLLSTAKALEDAGDVAGALRHWNQAQKVITADKAVNVPQIFTGAGRTYEGLQEGDYTKAGFGVAEMGGGAASLMGPRTEAPKYDSARAEQLPLPLMSDLQPLRGPGTADENDVVKQLTTMMGRRPTSEEIEAHVNRIPRAEEQTGRVAEFDRNDIIWERLKTTDDPNYVRKIIQEQVKVLQEGEGFHSEQAVADAALILDKAHARWNELLQPPAQSTPQFPGGGNIPVRIPGRGGAAEWPPGSGNVVSPVRNAIPEQPNLPGLPVPSGARAPVSGPSEPEFGPYGDTRLQEMLPLGERGPGTAADNELLKQLRQMLGRDPTDEEYFDAMDRQVEPGDVTGRVAQFPDSTERSRMEDARFHQQLGVAPSATPTSPIDLAVNDVLKAFARNPNLPMVEVQRMLSHLPPAEAQRAQTLVIQMVQQSNRMPKRRPIVGDPLRDRTPDDAWEETPAEAMSGDWPPGSGQFPNPEMRPPEQGQLPFGPMDLRQIPESIDESVPYTSEPTGPGTGQRDMFPRQIDPLSPIHSQLPDEQTVMGNKPLDEVRRGDRQAMVDEIQNEQDYDVALANWRYWRGKVGKVAQDGGLSDHYANVLYGAAKARVEELRARAEMLIDQRAGVNPYEHDVRPNEDGTFTVTHPVHGDISTHKTERAANLEADRLSRYHPIEATPDHLPAPEGVGGEGGPTGVVPKPLTQFEKNVIARKAALERMGVDTSNITTFGQILDAEDLIRQEDARIRHMNEHMEPEEQMFLPGAAERGPEKLAQGELPSPNDPRNADILKIALMEEAGLTGAQQIRDMHAMYGQPIRPSDELGALAEYYERRGDPEKAAHYNHLADRANATEQGQIGHPALGGIPPGARGGAPEDDLGQMSQEWLDILQGRRPGKGTLGIEPTGGMKTYDPDQFDKVLTSREKKILIREGMVDNITRLEDEIRKLDKQAEAAMESEDYFNSMHLTAEAERKREMAATMRMNFAKQWRGHMKEIERFDSMARQAEAEGNHDAARRLRAQADTEYRREAGQLELRFRKSLLGKKMREMGFTLSEETINKINNLDPDKLSHALQKDFADLLFSGVGKGEPGLSVVDVTDPPTKFTKEYHITIRNDAGQPVAHAEIRQNPRTGQGDLDNWAVNQNAGFGQVQILQLAQELEKRNALVPSGPYSEDTRNFLQRLRDAFLSEKGSTPIFTGGGRPTRAAGGGAGGSNPPPPNTPPIPPAGGNWWDKLSNAAGWGKGRSKGPSYQQAQYNFIDEVFALPKNATTTMDLSAPFRQGISMVLTPQFWSASKAMFGGMSEQGFQQIDAKLRNLPVFQPGPINKRTGKPSKSIAEKAGMRLFVPTTSVGPRAQAVASAWLENGKFLGPAAPLWAHSAGKVVGMSNRAYLTFLNHLNANRFQFLMDRGQDMSLEALSKGEVRTGIMPWKTAFSQQDALQLDPYRNIVAAREIADAVNTLTGHGPLKGHYLPLDYASYNVEPAARTLGKYFFSPGLASSRLRLVNPSTYIMASPQVRAEYLRGALSVASAYLAGATLLKMYTAGVGKESEINTDPTSADFMKIRVGNFRVDPAGGFQQWLVLFARMISGGYSSAAGGNYHEFGEGYQATTQLDMLQRFGANKLEPLSKLAYDMARASEYQPVHLGDRTLQLFTPLILQDMYEIAKEDPSLLPMAIPAFFGAGTQIYDKGESVAKLLPTEYDKVYTGSGAREFGLGIDPRTSGESNRRTRQIGGSAQRVRKLGRQR